MFKGNPSISSRIRSRPGSNCNGWSVSLSPGLSEACACFIDLQAVTTLEPCALLYLVALLNPFKVSPAVRLRGSYPTSPEAGRVLYEARFEEFIGTRPKLFRGVPRESSLSLTLTSGDAGRTLDPKDWITLHNFPERTRAAHKETRRTLSMLRSANAWKTCASTRTALLGGGGMLWRCVPLAGSRLELWSWI